MECTRIREFAKCRVELKDIPASLKLAKAVDGSARLVAGTANEYDVAYTLTVSLLGELGNHAQDLPQVKLYKNNNPR